MKRQSARQLGEGQYRFAECQIGFGGDKPADLRSLWLCSRGWRQGRGVNANCVKSTVTGLVKDREETEISNSKKCHFGQITEYLRSSSTRLWFLPVAIPYSQRCKVYQASSSQWYMHTAKETNTQITPPIPAPLSKPRSLASSSSSSSLHPPQRLLLHR